MTDVYITTIKIRSSIERLAYGEEICDVQIYEDDIQVRQGQRLTGLLESFESYSTVSFVDIARLPLWFYLGSPFHVYTSDQDTLGFFKKVVRLAFGKQVGLLVRGDLGGIDPLPEDKVSDDGLKKDEFYMVIAPDANMKIQMIPLQMTDFFVKKFIQKCHAGELTDKNQFLEFEDGNFNDKNEILDKFSERRKIMNPFKVTGSFSSANHPTDSVSAVPNNNIRKNLITDQDSFKKTLLSFVNSELRLRNITAVNNKDYQSIINHVFKMSYFSFRKDLAAKDDICININDLRDVVIKLMDILV